MELDLAPGEGSEAVLCHLASFLKNMANLTIDEENHLVGDGVDVDSVPFAVGLFVEFVLCGVGAGRCSDGRIKSACRTFLDLIFKRSFPGG